MNRTSISIYGLTIVSVIILFLLIASAIPTTTNAIKTADDNATVILNNMNDFDDAASFHQDNYNTVTVNYVFADNSKVIEPYVVYVEKGKDYYIEVPQYDNYSSNVNVIFGTSDKDNINMTVIYNKDS